MIRSPLHPRPKQNGDHRSPLFRRVDRQACAVLWSRMRVWLSLLVSLAIFIPASVRGELPEFAPPPATAPFDDVDDATRQVEVTRQAFAFLHTLQEHWGQGPERLRSVVAGPVEREEESALIYLRNMHNHGVLEGYEFRKGSLTRGQYVIIQGPLNGLNEFIDYYTALKQALSSAYGEPRLDRVVWENDLYYALPAYWGVAVMVGHLRYEARWETPEGTLTLDLNGNRYSRLSMEYRARGQAADT